MNPPAVNGGLPAGRQGYPATSGIRPVPSAVFTPRPEGRGIPAAEIKQSRKKMEQEEKKLETIFSVSEFIALLNEGLNKSQVKMIGEVSEAKVNSSGHVYFVLKDKKDGSVMNCAIWKHRYAMYGIKLKEGMEIIVFGHPNIHKTYGFSFIAETIELAGEGALKKEYERLKKKLTEEGIFAKERKRPIPKYCRKVGLITSKQGAVLGDFLSNLGKYGFQIKMIDSRVEGQEAVPELLRSIKTFRTQAIDVLAIIRGGGSSEAIEVFSNELLVREAANFPVPVIAGIGHDKDEPLLALAADAAESTPTAVANLLNESWEEALFLLERYERGILGYCDRIFEKYRNTERSLMISFGNYKNILLNVRVDLRNSIGKSFFGFRSLLLKINRQLEHAGKVVELNSPERQLKIGYSIARCGGKIIRSVQNVKLGDSADIQIADGKINSEIKKIYPIQ